MNLNQTLLDAARDEVRTDKNNRYKAAFGQEAPQEGLDTALVIERFAALLAMEKQAKFYEWTHQKYLFYERGKKWKLRYAQAGNRHVSFTTEQLYEIFTTQQ